MPSGNDWTHQNPYGSWSEWYLQPQTSYGALPAARGGHPTPLGRTSFRFVSRRTPSNFPVCSGTHTFFNIQTANRLTTISDHSGRQVGRIIWHACPVIERPGWRATAPEWLRPEGPRKVMVVKGVAYKWSADDQRFSLTAPPGVIATAENVQGEVHLVYHTEVASPDLLEDSVVALIVLLGPAFVGLR